MGVIGDTIRFFRDLTKDALNECGAEEIKEEIKDAINAIKGK